MRINRLFLGGMMALALLVSTSMQAQQDKAQRPSPPAEAKATVGGKVSVMINYSSPAVKGRKVWGELVPYGEVWRTGANEATTFEISKDAFINGQKLPAGKYSLFTIPGEKSWVVIFNKEPNQWGAYNYKQDMDALRINVTPKKSKTFNERLTITATAKGLVTIAWENLMVSFKVKAA